MAENKWPLLEDHLLRGFPPITPSLQALQFGALGDEPLSAIQEVSGDVTLTCVAAKVEPDVQWNP